MSRVTKKAAKPAKVSPSRFTIEEIHNGLFTAAMLCCPSCHRYMPAIEVKWAAAEFGTGIPEPGIGNRYAVSVDVPTEELCFDVRSDGRKSIRVQLAEGLLRTADYLEKAARGLRFQAEFQCRVEKTGEDE